MPYANRTAEIGADDVQRRTHASFGDHALAFAARGTDVAGKDRTGLRARAQQRCCGDAAWRRPHTIGKWRKRFIADRIEGLYDEMRTGRPPPGEDEAVAELITKTLARKPKAATHWSVRAIAKETGIAKSTVHRLFQPFCPQPPRTPRFKLSTDPFFVEKLRDVVGLYLNPPDKAVVLCVDEKSQIQALERTQPMLPMGFGYVEGVTHDYQRHGTTTLFAALNVLDGAVIAQCKPRHRHQEFPPFLRHIDTTVPRHPSIPLFAATSAPPTPPKATTPL